MKKVALFAFNGEPMCFVHALINAQDFRQKGYDVKLIIEGSATKLVRDLADSSKPFAGIYKKVKDAGFIDCVCKACAQKMDALDAALEQDLPLCNELAGHPSMARYKDQGYDIIVF